MQNGKSVLYPEVALTCNVTHGIWKQILRNLNPTNIIGYKEIIRKTTFASNVS